MLAVLSFQIFEGESTTAINNRIIKVSTAIALPSGSDARVAARPIPTLVSIFFSYLPIFLSL
jgi:hypothetical protein